MTETKKEFPAADYQEFVGKRVVRIEETDSDEGFRFVFDDGSWLDVVFSGCEGWIQDSTGRGAR